MSMKTKFLRVFDIPLIELERFVCTEANLSLTSRSTPDHKEEAECTATIYSLITVASSLNSLQKPACSVTRGSNRHNRNWVLIPDVCTLVAIQRQGNERWPTDRARKAGAHKQREHDNSRCCCSDTKPGYK